MSVNFLTTLPTQISCTKERKRSTPQRTKENLQSQHNHRHYAELFYW